MPARLAQQDDENGMMEATCPQAVSAGLANSDGLGALRLHPGDFPGREGRRGYRIKKRESQFRPRSFKGA